MKQTIKKTKLKKLDQNHYSKFWFDDNYYNDNYYTSMGSVNNQSYSTPKIDENYIDAIKLSAFKRSVCNFVKILTEREIPVKFSEKSDTSYTDGKSIVLSGDVDKKFDSAVGLSLHEASHILLTDFSFLKELFVDSQKKLKEQKIDRYISNETIDNFRKVCGISINKDDDKIFLTMQFKDILNWIEDRRIDNFIFTTSPGYQGYYEQLYKRYFYSNTITKVLKNNKLYKTETFSSYMFRLTNLLNKNTDVNSLKGLREIKNVIDVKNISRLKTTQETALVASKVLKIIVDNITSVDEIGDVLREYNNQQQGSLGRDFVEVNLNDLTNEQCLEIFGISLNELNKILKDFETQKKFTSGEIKKKTLSRSKIKITENVSNCNVSIHEVFTGGSYMCGGKYEVILINNLKGMINEKITITKSNNQNYHSSYLFQNYNTDTMSKNINLGFTLGRRLGKLLEIRNEEKNLKFTKQKYGKIDRSVLSSLGYDVENVFYKIQTNKFKKLNVHISIDASGSMGGEKFYKTIVASVAIAVACKTTNNINCSISFRSTMNSNPLLLMAYDSKINDLEYIKKYFKHLNCGGLTPESLCYDVLINKVFSKFNRDEQLYFINFSDGEPTMYNSRDYNSEYSGSVAREHCIKMINKMKQEYDTTIISYFITDYEYADIDDFKKMYGAENSEKIDVKNIIKLASTINKRFLNDENKITTFN